MRNVCLLLHDYQVSVSGSQVLLAEFLSVFPKPLSHFRERHKETEGYWYKLANAWPSGLYRSSLVKSPVCGFLFWAVFIFFRFRQNESVSVSCPGVQYLSLDHH